MKLKITLFIIILNGLMINHGLSQWVQATGMPGGAVTSITTVGSTVFATTGTTSLYGVSKSTDNGMTWSDSYTGLTSHYVNCMVVKGSDLYVGTTNLVFKSIDNGVNWDTAGTGITAATTSSNITSMTVSGTTIFAGSLAGVYRSTDNGGTWSLANSGIPAGEIWGMASAGGKIFAGHHLTGVYISTDNGDNWTLTNTGITGSILIHHLSSDGNSVYVNSEGTGGGFFKFNGTDWSGTGTMSCSGGTGRCWINASEILCGNDCGFVFYSSDGGANLTNVSSTGIISSIYDISSSGTSGTNAIVGTHLGPIFYRPLSQFAGGGTSIPTAPTSLTITPLRMSSTASSGNIGLTWTDNSSDELGFQIQRSLDGTAYTSIDSVLANISSFTDVTTAPTTLYYYRVAAFNAVGLSGYSNVVSATTLVNSVNDVLLSLNQLSISPNPAHTRITLTGIKNQTEISVFNLVGELIYSGQGKSEMTVDVSTLGAGIYILRFVSESCTTTRKLVIN